MYFTYLAVGICVYLAACKLLRFARVRHYQRRFGGGHGDGSGGLGGMRAEEAWEIQLYVFQLEFPFTAEKALQFALFRTYGIPSISKLLVKTSQFSERATATKRFADTGTLIVEFVAHPPSSVRHNAAIARMNFIHSGYQRAGKISNDDLLYTLSLFCLEPVRWIARYEWRELTPTERCALGVFWKGVGDAMGIDYGPLQGNGSWKDGLEWLDSVDLWSQAYEKETMVANEWNKKTADQTTAILLYDLPFWAKGTGKNLVSALMDDRLRRAMMYPDTHPFYPWLVETVFGLRKMLLRHFSLPRPYFMRFESVSHEPDPDTGRYHRTVYAGEPW